MGRGETDACQRYSGGVTGWGAYGGPLSLWLLDKRGQMGDDGLCFVTQRLSVPVHLILDGGKVAAFEGLGNDHCWHPLGCLGSMKSLADLLDIMAVNHDSIPSKALEPLPAGGGVSGLADRRHLHRVDPQLGGQVP